MLRRRKSDVETELPDRTDRQHFVQLTPKQQQAYDDHDDVVARLAAIRQTPSAHQAGAGPADASTSR